MFNVDNNSDDEHQNGSMRQGGTSSRAPLPSFNKGGLQHLANLHPQMVRSTQTDPNEIQLDDIP
jgi:hypothetical protein